jgi:hypothetical protein
MTLPTTCVTTADVTAALATALCLNNRSVFADASTKMLPLLLLLLLLLHYLL